MAIAEHDLLIRMDLAYLQDHSSGRLLSRFTNDANLLRMAVSRGITGLGSDILKLIFLVGLMFHQDWLLAAVRESAGDDPLGMLTPPERA